MTLDQQCADILGTASKLEQYGVFLKTYPTTPVRLNNKSSFLSSARTIGLSTEGLDTFDALSANCLSMEAAEEATHGAAALLTKLTTLFTKHKGTITEARSYIQMGWGMLKDMRAANEAAALRGAVSHAGDMAEHAAAGSDAVLHGMQDVIKQTGKGIASTKQIKMILLAMTAALGFVGFALTSLTSAIRQKEGLPTFSEKLSARLRNIRWPFGDIGISKSSDTHLGSLTVDGKAPTSVEQDAAPYLISHPSASDVDLSLLPEGNAPSMSFTDQAYGQQQTSVLASLKAHPIASILGVAAMITGVFLLCNKLITYLIKGGYGFVKSNLALYRDALKVRPLK